MNNKKKIKFNRYKNILDIYVIYYLVYLKVFVLLKVWLNFLIIVIGIK